ncbi:hypothetical protein PTKIN_Ptkin03bG0081600 [Pterospermum kingtungense]
MESDLLEISGEDDDSLLLHHHQSQSDDVSTCFSCSPLHFPRSNPTDEKAKNPSLLSNVNKENVNNNENKSELPMLSLEPQQMKRKKKGGFNLRKSIAWNRAFFTEEGVLNSEELSLISGNLGKLSEEKLTVIEEERRESLSGDSPDLQALEDNLFKELPLKSSSKKKVEKKIGSGLLQKSSGSAPRSTVKPDVRSVQDVNRSGSKRSGCPRPALPANVSTRKTAVKELKISKIPVPKPHSSVLSTTSKSAPNINKPKLNQSAQAAVNAHRSTRLTGSNRSTQNEARSASSSRSQITASSAQPAKKNVRSSALIAHSSTYSQRPLVTKADNGLKVNQDPVSAAGHQSINYEVGPRKIASLPQSGSHVGGNTLYAQAQPQPQPQMAKPSGLRMPSPSLGFFAQSKNNATHNLQSSTQPCNNPKSNMPNLRKLGFLNSICENLTPIKVDVGVNDAAAITKAKMSSTEPSVSSIANSLCENSGSNSRASKMLRVEVKVPCNSENYELANNQQQLHKNDNDLMKQIENVRLQCTDNKLLLQSQSPEQVKLNCKREDLVIPRSRDHNGDKFKDPCFVSHHSLQIKGTLTADDVGDQLSGHEHCKSSMEDFDLFPQLHSVDVNGSNLHGSPEAKDGQASIHDGHGKSNKQAEQENPCSFDDGHIINDIERPHINEGTFLKEGEPSEDFLSYKNVESKGPMIYPEAAGSVASELERTDDLSHCRDSIQGKDHTGGADCLNLQSHVGDTQMHAFEGNPSLESSSGLLNSSEVDNQHTLVNDVNTKLVAQPPFLDPGIVEERVFQDNYGSHTTDCLLHGETFCSEEMLAANNLQSLKDVASEIADGHRSKMENSSACWTPPTLQSCVHEMAEAVECQHVENAVSVSTDTPCKLNIELLSEATSKRLERNGEDQVIGAITACDFGVSNDCQSSGYPNDSEMDNSHSISHLSPVVQTKGYTEVDDIIDLKSVEGNQYCLSAKCNSSNSEPGEKITSCHIDASSMLTNSSTDKQDDCEKSIAQAELIQSFEAGKALQENQITEACLDLLSVEGKYGEESQNFDSDIHTDVNVRDKSSIGQATEGPSDLSQVEHTDEPNERCAAGSIEMTRRSFGEGVHLQSFDDGISFSNCKSNLSTSAENNSLAVVEDLNEPPELQNIVLVEPIMSDKFELSCKEEMPTYVKIEQSDHNHDCYSDIVRPGNEQSDQATSLNFELSSLSEDQISGAGCKLQAFVSLNEDSTSSIKRIHTSSSGNVLEEEVKKLDNDGPQELNSAMISVEAKGETILLEKTGKKQDAPVVKPPLNAVPFSDEWLAAFEAAGEEILTMKRGAVQNSPKDKSLPEPGPWSPVRRKNNQEIGPFDCTKFTNTNIPFSPASD